MRILAAIANYGTRNTAYLERLIREYRSMPHRLHLVVLSDIPKDLGPDIEVRTGLPAKNPWSLPFVHKKLFAERIDDYDLFIYSEDDILITRNNIETFLRLTKVLPGDRVSGFLRYEMDPAGRRWYPDFLSSYHWLPDSVAVADGFTFAEFSNLHSACYVLTREQLRNAIRSGGYLVGPHEGRYDLLCSAATDPYAQCGLRKVICISHIAGAMVHHLSNRYAGDTGISAAEFDEQIAIMLSAGYRANGSEELFPARKNIDSIAWDKAYFSGADHALISSIPRHAANILSVGCGYPSTEAVLAERGHTVTAIPLDPIVGGLAASRGIRVTRSGFREAFRELEGSVFDCVFLPEVLQHVEDPVALLSRTADVLAPRGELLISVPNFKCVKYAKDHFPYPIFKRWSYSRNRLHMIGRRGLAGWLHSLGMKDVEYRYIIESRRLGELRPSSGILDAFLASRLIARAKR